MKTLTSFVTLLVRFSAWLSPRLPARSTAGKRPAAPVSSIRLGPHPDRRDLSGLARVDFEQASEIAAARVEGRIVRGGLVVENGNLFYVFRIVRGRDVMRRVIVDPGNGRVLGVDRG
jgi:hypothetical protein